MAVAHAGLPSGVTDAVLPLSVLDLSPVPSGTRPSQALQATIELAKVADGLGYHRYWLAEHHSIPSVASSSPEIMIAAVAAATTRIRVGSGGVMLPNHSPLKVAESFRVLEGLHPGRIDLGIGRAPGTDQLTALALRRSRETLGADDFPEQYAELRAYVDGFPDGHPLGRIKAMPDDVELPDVWILGSSLYGGQAAARFGTGFAFAGHFASVDAAEAVAGYRSAFRPSPQRQEPAVILGAAALVAESPDRAEELFWAHALSMVRLRTNRPTPLPSPDEAAAHPWTERELAIAESLRHGVSVGTPEQVAADLAARADYAGADEVMVTTQVHDEKERQRSFELLMPAWVVRRGRR